MFIAGIVYPSGIRSWYLSNSIIYLNLRYQCLRPLSHHGWIKLNVNLIFSYLLRNFKLFQLESTYEIRGDVEDAVTRLKPWTAEDGEVIFGGWARMALPLLTFVIVEVAKPKIGEKQPSRVRADITVNLSVKDDIKREWEGLRRHDVVFLVTVRPPVANQENQQKYDFDGDFVPQVT